MHSFDRNVQLREILVKLMPATQPLTNIRLTQSANGSAPSRLHVALLCVFSVYSFIFLRRKNWRTFPLHTFRHLNEQFTNSLHCSCFLTVQLNIASISCRDNAFPRIFNSVRPPYAEPACIHLPPTSVSYTILINSSQLKRYSRPNYFNVRQTQSLIFPSHQSFASFPCSSLYPSWPLRTYTVNTPPINSLRHRWNTLSFF